MENIFENKKIRKFFGTALLLACPFFSFGQVDNWQNLDLNNDNVLGISTEKAYKEIIKNKKGKKVKVAVLDSGIDIYHEDLSKIISVKKKEKNNNKDDDKNGFIDDRFGWSFLGKIDQDNLELTRIVRSGNVKFLEKNENSFALSDKEEYQQYLILKKELENKISDAKMNLTGIEGIISVVENLVKKTGKENPTAEDIRQLKGENPMQDYVIQMLSSQLEKDSYTNFYNSQLKKANDYYKDQVAYHLNLDFDPRNLVGDNYNDVNEYHYGSNDVIGPDALHGTHVAGIIAANRKNKKGIKGIANNVDVLVVRTVPNGDERDKDVANSIRYAVNEGAKVINMSFGKGYTTHKAAVDEAVKYALSKDVLLIHAAGNDNKNLEKETNYPNKQLLDGTIADNWIEVGASSWTADSTLKAPFSNYGKTKVDLFAPGVDINSTIPGSKYLKESGTSMAAPVVAGIAALIRSQYPKLTAVEVKEILMKSVTKINYNVLLKVGSETEMVPFTELCVSGGVVNAYEALKLASTYK